MEIEKVEQFVRAHANPDFRYENNEEAPFVRLAKKVSEAKGVVISTGGIFVKGHQPFNDNFGIGYPSYREIPSDMAANMLSRYHEHYDHTNAIKDINCVFPIERMRELQAGGLIGSLAETFYSFMGYLTVTYPAKEDHSTRSSQEIASRKCGFCYIGSSLTDMPTNGQVARVLEEKGIATVTLSLMRDVSERVKAPRTVLLKFPFGSPLGKPGDIETQTTVLKTALSALEKIDTAGTIIEPKIRY